MPEAGIPAGYAAIIERYDLFVPNPPVMAAIARRHHPRSTKDWYFVTPRQAPAPQLGAHLSFAFRYEGIDLQILARLFSTIDAADIETVVRTTPTGSFSRRLWFLYEWLTGRDLDIADPGKIRFIPVLNPDQQFALATGTPSPRHKVVNNLPGTHQFCPLVRRTGVLENYAGLDLPGRAAQVMGKVRPDIMARAAAFLLLSDSKSSFAIEGERPTGRRAARWGQAIAQAGNRPLSVDEFNRLQHIVIGDARFVRLGLRHEGGFVGTHDRETNMPVPDHISARFEDLPMLMQGVVDFSARAVEGGLDPVITAASLAFGFVYIHPYVDGNGRLHRWLFHHALAQAEYSPAGLVFPVSAAILRNLESYRQVLESYSAPLLPFIEWERTATNNVEVLNETLDYYRFFDATAHAQFLYGCVQETIDEDLPDEVWFLQAFDRFNQALQDIVDMPTTEVELLCKFLSQNAGRLSKRARQNEFEALTPDEHQQIEALYADTFAREPKG
ncbi:Fic family protein [Asticcacaulis sp. AC402]|uniref:Fic family protein n=1 Tax=Asticcacaulis sp. AC402 TaxID=1282361 RepID=UPI001F43B5BF|nr:Fic family protein [Asticcacaulis sp. AC402]